MHILRAWLKICDFEYGNHLRPLLMSHQKKVHGLSFFWHLKATESTSKVDVILIKDYKRRIINPYSFGMMDMSRHYTTLDVNT